LHLLIIIIIMKIPTLKQGDTIKIIAPARKISYKELESSLLFFKHYDLNVILGNNIFNEFHQFAGTDEERTADFQEALDNPNVKAIFCARGGYGNLRIIDNLNFTSFKKNPKWICGYSDTTVVHAHLQQLGFPSLHCAMPIDMANMEIDNESITSMMNALFNGKLHYTINPHPLNKSGSAKGKLCGGNLSILYAINNSVSDSDTKNKILFIEDVDEYLYHIDRMMLNLKRSNKLSHLKALIVGGMSKMNDNIIPYGLQAEEIILEHTKDFDYPICFGFPAGHIQLNKALLLGTDTEIIINENNVQLING
jgi:muramoyltetrapeptide carboxypeptidase